MEGRITQFLNICLQGAAIYTTSKFFFAVFLTYVVVFLSTSIVVIELAYSLY